MILLAYLSSCTTYKQLQYLQGDIDSTKYSQFKVPEQRIQKGDQISIAVFSDNAAASSMFNTGSIPQATGAMGQSAGSGVSAAGNVYEVDQEGNIFFPQIGKLNVEGLTREGMTKFLDSKLKDKLLINPYYVIRFLNLKITVFGDVGAPGVYPLVRENTNIFEALTLAGDMTFFGKRENVLIIREKDGKRVFARIDVTKPDVFNSPYYYLQQNDIVFVDMRKGIAMASGDVIGILNADDLYADNGVIAKVAAVFENPAVDATYADLVFVDREDVSKVVRTWKSGPFKRSSMYNGWMPPHPTFFVRRSMYEKYGLFNTILRSAADYELMLRFLLKHEINLSYIPQTIINMRQGGKSTASISNRIKANVEDRKAWRMNGLKPHFFTLILKPLRKIKQFISHG